MFQNIEIKLNNIRRINKDKKSHHNGNNKKRRREKTKTEIKPQLQLVYREVDVVAEQRSNDCVDTLVPDVLARAPAHKASSFNDFEFDARDGSLPDPLPLDCNVRVC